MSKQDKDLPDSSNELYVYIEPQEDSKRESQNPSVLKATYPKPCYKASDSRYAIFTQCYQCAHLGSGATVAKARCTFVQLDRFIREAKFPGVAIDTLTPKQIRLFLESFKERLCARTIENKLSHIRVALEGNGRELGDVRKPDNPYSLNKMGLNRGTRRSTKKPCNMEVFAEALEKATPAFKLMLRSELLFGLRRQEAIMIQNTPDWIATAQAHVPGQPLLMLLNHGTKGGRKRVIQIRPNRVEKAIALIHEIHDYQQAHKFLIQADSLKQALSKYAHQMQKLGLTGENSGHSLRRYFAFVQFCDYLGEGYTEAQALSRLAEDLGHGEGRAQWVKTVYLAWLFYGDSDYAVNYRRKRLKR